MVMLIIIFLRSVFLHSSEEPRPSPPAPLFNCPLNQAESHVGSHSKLPLRAEGLISIPASPHQFFFFPACTFNDVASITCCDASMSEMPKWSEDAAMGCTCVHNYTG